MKSILLSLAVIVTFASCEKSLIAAGTPSCIKKMILDNKDDRNWEVGKVEEYKFQGKLVYALQPDNRMIADGATRVVSNDCVSICSVGGFGGPAVNLCNGENFFQNAILIREIWNKY